MPSIFSRAPRIFLPALLGLALLGIAPICGNVQSGLALAASPSADPAFVGILSLAVDPDVSKKLGLPVDTMGKLRELVDTRQREVRQLVFDTKDLPAAERDAKLKAYADESEKLGLALLTGPQRLLLDKARVARDGMATILEPAIAEKLKISDEQKTAAKEIIDARKAEQVKAGQDDMEEIHNRYERKLSKLLTPEQRSGWFVTAGLAPEPDATAVAEAKPTDPTATDKPSDDKPATDKPALKKPGSDLPPLDFPDLDPDLDPDFDPDFMPADDLPPKTTPSATDKPKTTPSTSPSTTPSTGPGRTSPSRTAPPTRTGEVRPRPRSTGPKELKFSFAFKPWRDVLEWFADQADLSLVTDVIPPGTFNYVDDRIHTPAEALNVLNSVLLTKGYTIIRRDKALIVVNLEDGIPPNLITEVKAEELDKLGDFELVRCVFQVDKMTPQEAELEIRKLLGPQGSIVVMPKARQLSITETAGKLRTIRGVIRAVESPPVDPAAKVRVFALNHVTVEEVLPVIRQLLGLPEERNIAADGSLRIAVEPLGGRLFVTGKPEMITKMEEILALVDKRVGGSDSPKIIETPQLETYTIPTADSASVLAVLQTMLAGQPDVRLALDPKTGNLIAFARPTQQGTIKATIDQMERDARQFDVIRLRTLDPTLAALMINRLFGVSEDEKAPVNNAAPRITADPSTRTLFVAGTKKQIEQIRTLLAKMGELPEGSVVASETVQKGNRRVIALTGRSQKSVIEQMESIWPTMRANKVRVVTTSTPGRQTPPGKEKIDRTVPPTFEKHDEEKPDSGKQNPAHGDRAPAKVPDSAKPATSLNSPKLETPSKPAAPAINAEPMKPAEIAPATTLPSSSPGNTIPSKPAQPREDKDASRIRAPRVRFVSYVDESPATAAQSPAAPSSSEPAAPAAPPTAPKVPKAPLILRPAVPAIGPTAAPKTESAETVKSVKPTDPASVGTPGADIVVIPGPTGIMIISDDLKALDEFEELLNSLADNTRTSGGRQFTVFYLKYCRADVASERLMEIFNGAAVTESGGGSLLTDMASMALGGNDGGLMGSLLGLGGGASGGSTSAAAGTGAVTIVPDSRLNALIVQANATDLDSIEQLLEVIDQETSPEDVQTVAKPRMIPVINTSAETIANVVRQVYATRIEGAAGGQQRQPSPEEFMRALRGGGNQRGGRGGNQRGGARGGEEEQKMTVGVDTRSNSLVVAAPEPLFSEVKELVASLDSPETDSNETMRVVTLKRSNPQMVQKALTAIAGDSIKTSTIATTGTTRAGMPGMGQTGTGFNPGQQNRAQPQMQLFNQQGFGGQQGFTGQGFGGQGQGGRQGFGGQGQGGRQGFGGQGQGGRQGGGRGGR